MKLIADEHVSQKIVRAVSEMALDPNWNLSSIITDGNEFRGQHDEDWISIFAGNGGQVIVSADRKMLKRPTLIKKVCQLGLIGIYFPAEWAESRCGRQAAHMLYWWPRIEQTILACQKGTAWVVPKGFGSGDLRQYEPKNKAVPT